MIEVNQVDLPRGFLMEGRRKVGVDEVERMESRVKPRKGWAEEFEVTSLQFQLWKGREGALATSLPTTPPNSLDQQHSTPKSSSNIPQPPNRSHKSTAIFSLGTS